MMDTIINIVNVVTAVTFIASIVVKATPTLKDDAVMAKIMPYVEMLAIVTKSKKE